MPLTEAEARDLLRKVLEELWAADRSPIPGSRLKAALVHSALKTGSDFDEKALGYKGFADFLSKSGVAAVKFRTGTDVLIAPIEYADELNREPDKRVLIRPDFWRAFVSFRVPGEVRAYDRVSDSVIIGPPGTMPADVIPIDPISAEMQLDWRRNFVNSLGPASPLTGLESVLTSPAGFRRFSQVLRQNLDLHARWNEFWVNEICAVIRTWGQRHGISDEVWLHSPTIDKAETLRAKLYKVLDAIPIERLLELQIPLRWLVDKKPPT